MDAADYAQDYVEEAQRKASLEFKPITAPYSGVCLICEEPVDNARFCGVPCRDEFDRRIKAKTFAGTHIARSR